LSLDGDSFIDVFVGKNGTGKSNLFEALIEIFRHIVEFDRDKASCDFNYRIGFEIDGKATEIGWNSGTLTIGGKERKTIGKTPLPDNVLIYYSGHNDTVANLVEQYEEAFRKRIKRADFDRRFAEISIPDPNAGFPGATSCTRRPVPTTRRFDEYNSSLPGTNFFANRLNGVFPRGTEAIVPRNGSALGRVGGRGRIRRREMDSPGKISGADAGKGSGDGGKDRGRGGDDAGLVLDEVQKGDPGRRVRGGRNALHPMEEMGRSVQRDGAEAVRGDSGGHGLFRESGAGAGPCLRGDRGASGREGVLHGGGSFREGRREMTAELILSFPNENQVAVAYAEDRTAAMDFAAPLTDADRDDIRWYLEVYGTQYTIDLDDDRAGRIVGKFKAWGEALFDAAFGGKHASRLFWNFYDHLDENGGLVTIDAGAPAVLSLPWELLCVDGRHLVHEDPHVSVRRRLTGASGTGRKFTPESKDALHLLFVVSRPKGAGFIDPRADAMAVMDALEENAPGRVEVEFLRPATLDNLTKRLKRQGPDHRNKPTVDILHFDGHGVFDPNGHLFQKAKKSDPAAATRDGGKADILPNTGYLLFEDDKGGEALITAETLGDMLTNQKVALTVLSACQSGAVGAEAKAAEEAEKTKAINGVAARLTRAGLPAVIAMSHTVLVETTRRLFGEFYARLGDHLGVGAALDEARRYLYAHPDRGERRRGERDVVTLKLYDWFLPALYQTGGDPPLLTADGGKAPAPATESPEEAGRPPAKPESGFHGRTVELWMIERAFLAGTRRITVTGFGGQGKTALAAETGRWLARSGMFQRCCFVSFAAFQGVDPVAFAVSSLSVALDRSLIDADAAEAALAEVPTLVILDNLESLTDADATGANDRQPPLLDAAARWSRAGGSRVLITTRQPKLDHPEFPAAGSREHQYLGLSGLAEHDAVRLFAALWELPPDPEGHIEGPPPRHGLVKLFKQVDFHPLSIGLLAFQLKSRRAAELGERLESLLKDAPGEGAEKNLRASLDLSLERLPEEAGKWLPRLGVFRGGGMEDVILQVTKISTWPALRQALETAGLVRAERLEGVAAPFLKFHPALAPALWERLPEADRADLAARHRAAYYRLSEKLYHQDSRDVHAARATARHELPNLLFAVKAALKAGDEDAVDFVNKVNRFLGVFGLLRDRDDLNQRAEAAAGPGTRAWYLAQSGKGEALFSAGRHREAEAVFRGILEALGEAPTYERCLTIGRLGRCLRALGRTKEAADTQQWELKELEKLEQTSQIRREAGTVYTDLADALTDMGDFPGARAAYEASLKIKEEIGGEERGTAVVQGQLGTLAMEEGNLAEAERRYREALQTFRRLAETASEAVAQNQLGRVVQRSQAMGRRRGRLPGIGPAGGKPGQLGWRGGDVQQSWEHAMVNAGRLAEAETWYRKSMTAFQEIGRKEAIAKVANNLAALLQNDPARLPEARQLAEQALEIEKTLDPGAAEIWKTITFSPKSPTGKRKPTASARRRRPRWNPGQGNIGGWGGRRGRISWGPGTKSPGF
jgi:tetratricopeptide (TPR) repeat protein